MEKAGILIGVSRTTSRRYIGYLVSEGTAIADLCNGTLGRPEPVYREIELKEIIYCRV